MATNYIRLPIHTDMFSVVFNLFMIFVRIF